jgi:hypothetical protein
MELGNSHREQITLVTLGPGGTCHERAAIEYMAFQGVDDFEIKLIDDFFDGLEWIRGKDNAFLLQCSAHPKVHEVTERYWAEVFVVDTLAPSGKKTMVEPSGIGSIYRSEVPCCNF